MAFKDIHRGSQIVLEVDRWVTELEKDDPRLSVQEKLAAQSQIKDDGVTLLVESQFCGVRDTILTRSTYKNTVENCRMWHIEQVKDALAKKNPCKWEDQWADGITKIDKEITRFEDYFLSRINKVYEPKTR
jgi:hypothetical protein